MKIVVVTHARQPATVQANAVGHLCLGLPSLVDPGLLRMRAFRDAGGASVARMTDHPLIVMTARSEPHLAEAVAAARVAAIPCNVFVACMTSANPEAQEEEIAATASDALAIIGIALFGTGEALRPLTRRFSLMRAPALEGKQP